MSGAETKKYMELWKTAHQLEGDAVTGGCDVVIQDKITDLKSSIASMMRGNEPESRPMEKVLPEQIHDAEQEEVSGVQRALFGQGDDINEVTGT